MTIEMRLAPRQALSLTLTPQLLQSIRLLQYDRHELGEFLRREAERNPLLAIAPAASAPGTRSMSSGSRGLPAEALLAEDTPSLLAHAAGEIRDILSSPGDRRLAMRLLADLTEAGHLPVDPDAAALLFRSDPPTVRRVIAALREASEPAGLFAADLRDCLAIQLRRRGELSSAMAVLLDRLELVARRDLAALSRLTGRDAAAVAAMIRQLAELDPKPGARFNGSGRADAVVPDVTVRKAAGGRWRVALQADAVPRIRLDSDAASRFDAGCRDQHERDFVAHCVSSVAWLERALEQRSRSILAVASLIMRGQERFLALGVGALAPMTMRTIAEQAGLHESTVSRIAANKFVETPRGTFEMRFFFSAAIGSTRDGEVHSAAGVKERIRGLLARECAGSVLSDDAIAARLRSEGVDLARRTVAKYREALGIASSAQRRRELGARRLAS